MADTPSNKLRFGIGQGQTREMVRLASGAYADVYAPAYGSGLVTDSTGENTFDTNSLPSRYKYDADGQMISATFGPDKNGLFVRQTSEWQNNLLVAESAWFLVPSLEAP